MDSQSFHQGNTLGDINTTPHQEHQKMCTRNFPCYQQGCSLCHAPTSHVLNLDKDLDSSNASSNPPTSLLPQPPDNHPIMLDISKRNPNQQCAWTGSFHTPAHKFHEIQPGIPERLLRFKPSSRTPPPLLQPIIRQAVLEDTYIDDWGFGAKSITELSEKQQEIESFLNKGGFHINSGEHSGENGSSKYLGMTLDCRQDCYLLKFHLNLHKKTLGIPAGDDLDSKFLQDHSAPITKKNVLNSTIQSVLQLHWCSLYDHYSVNYATIQLVSSTPSYLKNEL